MAFRRVVCGMSGGVDSAVTALLLKQRGFEVVGAFMKNWDIANETGVCISDKDLEDAAYTCSKLDIPLHEVNFVKEYWNDVFSKMIQGYELGTTPNPDVLCNRHVKFGHFYEYAMEEFGADAIATGHYARNSYGDFLQNVQLDKGAKLLCSVDEVKDQTLFLCQIRQEALRKTMFPLGSLYKSQVKKMACEAGLEKIAKRKESMGICFIGTRNFHNFIDDYIEPKPGNFVDLETGEVLGSHKGTHYWTLGQRSLISGKKLPHFVAKMDPKTQTIYVVPGTDHPALFTDTLTMSSIHWIDQPPKSLMSPSPQPHVLDFRFQHLHPTLRCTISQGENNLIYVTLQHPLRAITAGQYGVLYDGNVCLGSGCILAPGPSLYELNQLERVELREKFR